VSPTRGYASRISRRWRLSCYKGALTISQIQEKVRLASGSMTAGALLVGNAEEVIEKVVRYSEASGRSGIATFD
jgi:hypothetical protein